MKFSFQAGNKISIFLLRLVRGAGFLGILLTVGHAASGQVNFRPLERGDYTEVEEKIIMLKGLEISADYALHIILNSSDELPPEKKGTSVFQDLRLHLNTLFHRDVALHLTLELGKADFGDNNLRNSESDNRGRLANSQSTGIAARDAYLRYKFNPNSAILVGKYEVSIGDRRGKFFNAIAPAFTFDCELGTWCIPFGMLKTGPHKGDALYHFALQYTAWNAQVDGRTDTLEVEVFRARYSERDVPLAKNLGAGRFNPDNPTNITGSAREEFFGGADPSQYLENTAAAEPVYFDADSQDFFGFRIHWLGGDYFFNLDVVANKGIRKYHLAADPDTGTVNTLNQTGTAIVFSEIKGVAFETEFGMRLKEGFRFGLRFMTATGDQFVAGPGGLPDFTRDLKGFHEVTPGTYQGTRLYFNGADSQVDQGAGLGHSVNNTRLVGVFLEVNKDTQAPLAYTFGLFTLRLNEPIPNQAGELEDNIGIEINNLLIWNVHKALKFHFELNGIAGGGAFRVDDFSTPKSIQENFLQGIFRVVYSF